MELDDLVQKMVVAIDSGNFQLQVIFDLNIDTIEVFKSNGVTYLKLWELLNLRLKKKIEKNHYRDLIFRAKKKAKSKANAKSSIKTEVVNTKPATEKIEDNLKVQSNNKLKQSLEDWHLLTNIDISERQALRLENNGIDIDALNELNFTSINQISKHLTKIEHKKGRG